MAQRQQPSRGTKSNHATLGGHYKDQGGLAEAQTESGGQSFAGEIVGLQLPDMGPPALATGRSGVRSLSAVLQQAPRAPSPCNVASNNDSGINGEVNHEAPASASHLPSSPARLPAQPTAASTPVHAPPTLGATGDASIPAAATAFTAAEANQQTDEDEAIIMPTAYTAVGTRLFKRAAGVETNGGVDLLYSEKGRKVSRLNDDVRLRNTQLEEEALASRDELQRQTVVTTTSLRAVENLANQIEKKVLTDKRVNDIMKQAVSLTISKPPYINYAPDEAHWLTLFVELANVQPLSETAFKLKLELSNSDALERTAKMFNNRFGKRLSNLRLGALLNSPLKLIKAVINSDGKKCYKKDTEFALACVKWVAENAIDDTGIPWHEWLGVPFSSPAFLAVGKVWTGKAGPVVALHRHQLTLTMAVIRHKLRNPNMARVQLERSGDPDALGRQERVVQRLLNRFQATKYNGNNYFIGKLYLMDWVDVPENILALDFVGDRDVDDVVEGDLNGEGVEVIF
ncbi:hypothetical protein CLOP_g8331 [Closterium sp. NIES-67]|nr:hypothetical protein CLOP_g8331 [Closterium sp. NIES-67]